MIPYSRPTRASGSPELCQHVPVPCASAERDELLERIVAVLGNEERVRAAYLIGSMATGRDDQYSDIDILTVAAQDDYASLVRDWPGLCEQITPAVLQHQLGGGHQVLFTQITPRWLRFDVSLGVSTDVPARPRNWFASSSTGTT